MIVRQPETGEIACGGLSGNGKVHKGGSQERRQQRKGTILLFGKQV